MTTFNQMDLTEPNLKKALTYWQRRLRLQDWHIIVDLVRLADLDNGVVGRCKVSAQAREAKIDLLHPDDVPGQEFWTSCDWEHTFVHELLHIHLDVFKPDPNGLQHLALEQAINVFASALVNTWEEDKRDA